MKKQLQKELVLANKADFELQRKFNSKLLSKNFLRKTPIVLMLLCGSETVKIRWEHLREEY